MTFRPTIIFTAGDDLVSLAIRRFTRGATSHVAIGAVSASGAGPFVLHADHPRVALDLREHFQIKYPPVAEFAIVPDVSEGVRRALRQCGKHYDWLDIVRHACSRWLPPELCGSGLRPASAWTCVRLVLLLGVPSWRHLDPATTTPQDLLDVTSRSADFVRIR